jgi:alkanesulfonate monooxygenase SsuD/methylene tetrahydromethanopterin reductase-like flavin-dependent oxidoreductase (luciferase family)
VDLGLHLPLMQFGEEEQSLGRIRSAVDAARACGFAAVSANDHFVFSTPWLDGPTALAAVADRTGGMTVATTISLVVLRGPVPVAKMLAALDLLTEGRLVAGLGPGSSRKDYDALGIPFEERWKRFDEAVAILRGLVGGGSPPSTTRYCELPEEELTPLPRQSTGIPLWIGSWGSEAGLRRVARLADGWLASAYNTTPERFAAAWAVLAGELDTRGKDPERFPNALSTMWTWVTESQAEADRVLTKVLAPLLAREPEELRAQVCVGPPAHCAELLSRYAEAGCQRVYLWPLGDEARQIELVTEAVAPGIRASAIRPS